MIYPQNFEQKIGFDQIRQLLKDKCLSTLGEERVNEMNFSDHFEEVDELLNQVWGYDFIGETRTLDMHIRTLRQKLSDDADAPSYIRTVRGVGYQFVSEEDH